MVSIGTRGERHYDYPSRWRGPTEIRQSLSKQCNAANGNAQSKCKDIAAADYDAAKAQRESIGCVDQTPVVERDA
jgi:hypothetical protein